MGESDTETLLTAIEVWGVEDALKRAIGMFAIALWDSQTQTLILARDRMGEKPLYYGWHGQGSSALFLFGSELKALKGHPEVSFKIERNAIVELIRHGYIPAPISIYQGIFKLEPGCLLSVSLSNPTVKVKKYWGMEERAHLAKETPFIGSRLEAVDNLEQLMKNVVGEMMLSDVPIGAFLSGGVDSSLIVALMQSKVSQPIRTFTVGFDEPKYNEAPKAKLIAEYLGTSHTDIVVSSSDALNVILNLSNFYSEPFADSSQIPTLLVSKLAKQTVSVALTGDGGDELFGGYNRHKFTKNYWSRLAGIPLPVRKIGAKLISFLSHELFSGKESTGNFASKLQKIAKVLPSKSFEDYYIRATSNSIDPNKFVLNDFYTPPYLNDWTGSFVDISFAERVMYLDSTNYLPDDILVKLDRASMAYSLESRAPFLDHRIIDFALRLPLNLKISDSQTKWILRQILSKHVPQTLIENPKMGFSIPLGDWLRGPLLDWSESLLDEKRLELEGYLHPQNVRKVWLDHLSGKVDLSSILWSILMFQLWLEKNNDS